MADIFLSYAREDLRTAQLLAAALEQQGWSVWWDRSKILPGQNINKIIKQAISEAKCLVVIWSPAANESVWVEGEANIALRLGILVQIHIGEFDPPINFQAMHSEDFSLWSGENGKPEFEKLKSAVVKFAVPSEASKPNSEAFLLGVGDNSKLDLAKWKPLFSWYGDQNKFAAPETEDFLLGIGDKPGLDLEKLKFPLGMFEGQSTVATPIAEPSLEIPVRRDLMQPSSSNSARLHCEPEMVVIPSGSFEMGGNDSDNQKPIHKVTVAKPFKIGKYPVTFAEYDVFAETTGRKKPDDKGWGRNRRPVINVSWHEASCYAAWLREITGKSYRLPSEAEWEYACRAGTCSEFYWGNNARQAGDYAVFYENSFSKTRIVGQKCSNPHGLHDMAGNVWEWQQDIWHKDYQRAPNDGSAWLKGGASRRVVRGGSWFSDPDTLRSAVRDRLNPSDRDNDLGFRLAQDIP